MTLSARSQAVALAETIVPCQKERCYFFLSEIQSASAAGGIGQIEAPPQIDGAYDRGATRIERKLLKAPAGVKSTKIVIQGMRDDADAADRLRGLKRGSQRELKQ